MTSSRGRFSGAIISFLTAGARALCAFGPLIAAMTLGAPLGLAAGVAALLIFYPLFVVWMEEQRNVWLYRLAVAALLLNPLIVVLCAVRLIPVLLSWLRRA